MAAVCSGQSPKPCIKKTTKKKRESKQSKHLFPVQALESAADAFKGSAAAAELTNMHIQRMLEADCLHGMKAWRCVTMTDRPKDSRREGEQSMAGWSEEIYHAAGGLIGKRRGSDTVIGHAAKSLGEAGSLRKSRFGYLRFFSFLTCR